MGVTTGHRTDRAENAILIRQVWCVARLFQAETEYVAPHTDRVDFGGLRSRPWFVIDKAMRRAGYDPAGADYEKWNIIKRWMYGPTGSLRSRANPEVEET